VPGGRFEITRSAQGEALAGVGQPGAQRVEPVSLGCRQERNN